MIFRQANLSLRKANPINIIVAAKQLKPTVKPLVILFPKKIEKKPKAETIPNNIEKEMDTISKIFSFLVTLNECSSLVLKLKKNFLVYVPLPPDT